MRQIAACLLTLSCLPTLQASLIAGRWGKPLTGAIFFF